MIKKWKYGISLAIFSLGLMTIVPSNAQANSCNPCNPCDWDPCSLGEFEVEVDFLWWKPCVDDLDFAALVDERERSDKSIKYKSVCPEWEPGVRVTVGMDEAFCDLGLYTSYTYVCSDDSASLKTPISDNDVYVTSPLYHPELDEEFDSAKADWCSDYHEWNVLFGYDLSCKQCHRFKSLFGVSGIYLEQNLKVKYDDDDSKTINWDSEYWGVGFKSGFDYEYQYSECLRLYTRAHGAVLAGDACSKNKQSNESEGMTIKDDDCCQIVPGYNLALGVIYDSRVCDCDYALRLGYEFLQWHNLPNHRGFGTNTDADEGHQAHSSSPNVRTYGFHGLVAGLAVGF